MNLDDLAIFLKSVKTQDELDSFLKKNLIDITDLFYSLFSTDIAKHNLDSYYFGEILASNVVQDGLVEVRKTKSFVSFILLLGLLGEKLAEIDISSVADNIRSYLPESALKYRLKALSRIQNIDDVRVDYVNRFNEVLDLLLFAETFEGGGTLQTVEFLLFFYQKSNQKFLELNLKDEAAEFNALFVDADNLAKYHFLSHEALVELIAGRKTHELIVEGFVPYVLYPSDIIEGIFKDKINRKVFRLPGTVNLLEPMGLDSWTIRHDILNYGKTNFDENYSSEITAEIKALLYCYYNLKKHFFTSYAVFKKLWSSIKEWFSKTHKPVFIDLGCGPLTSGLAIGDLFYSDKATKINFTYIGVDISKQMLKQAQLFSTSDLFNQDHSFYFYSNWNEIPDAILTKTAGSSNPFIINASYLFASSSVDEVDLAKFVSKLANTYKNVHFVFQNPDRTDRNVKWENFKKHIKYKLIDSGVEKIIYKTAKNSYREPTYEDVYFEILTIFVS
jgi:hypothetical protein